LKDATGERDDINNVVLLADDLDWDSFNAVPRLAALNSQGTSLKISS